MNEQLGYTGKYLQHPRPSILARMFVPTAVIERQFEFPDISFWQGMPDFSKMGNAVILRAGQNVWVDTQFERNRREATGHNMAWGVYWFYDDRVSPAAQADKLYSLFSNGQARPSMEIFCDWENSFGGAYSGVKNVVAFMQRVESLMPWAKVGMYTGYYWFVGNTNTTTHAAQLAYLKTKPLWLAWYTANPANVLVPRPWTQVTHWQYGTPSRGAEFGVGSVEIDMNWYNGTQVMFNQTYGGEVQPPQPPPPPPIGDVKMAYTGTVLSDIQARTTAGGDIVVPGWIRKGSTIIASALNGQWLQLVSVNGIAKTGWVNSGVGQKFVAFAEIPIVTPPPPPPPPPPTGKVLTNVINVYNDGSIDVTPK